MRALIDLPDDQVTALAQMSAKEGLSRAALIRRAIARLISSEPTGIDDDPAFGSWKGGEDGLAYQRRLRAEW